ncbi:MAG: GH92 family glycosyl hydrolase [Verrucomicrobia bacterium]|nr:GH92 family glycosyl hydrolase [Verrucomicrobiota bacterium]
MRTVELVDCFMGTDSRHDFSHGNVLPLMALPWGTHHWSPANAAPDNWFFQYREHAFHGLRLTHQPSPWMTDWCSATLMPQAGARRLKREARSVELPSAQLTCRPHRFACVLPTEGIEWRAAPSMQGLAMHLRWRGDGPRRLIVDSGRVHFHGDRGNHDSQVRIDPARGEIVLRTRGGGGRRLHPDFAMHLVLRCEFPGIGGGCFDADGERDGHCEAEGPALGAWLELPPGGGEMRVWVAASFIDEASARSLIDQQVAGRDVEDIAAVAADAWDGLLDRLELPGADLQQRALTATLCYRTLLFPRRLDEPGPGGSPRHRCPDTGAICGGVRVTDNGFWDTARTVYPWYALLCPDHLPTILEGWVNGARITGWLPSWASPGHRNCMTGSYADAVFADAVARGIEGFDPLEVLRYLRRHVEEPVDDDAPYGRIGMDAYLQHGFVPHERINKSVARTLDYAYGDWCIARVAEAAGDSALADSCDARAGSWRQVLCTETGFFRGRHADGSWVKPFDPITWGGPYVEGSAWQFAWHVPHQPRELIAARGGAGAARAFLQRLLDEAPRYHVGTYSHVIHEMSEMAALDCGQYAHSNQPSHFTLPYLAHCGDPAAFGRWTRRICDLHRLAPDGFLGDEDNGEMSAWWLLAALGLFPDCPGLGDWLTVRPLFSHALLHVPGRPPLELRRNTNGEERHPDRWTGPGGVELRSGTHLNHAHVVAGGTWNITGTLSP